MADTINVALYKVAEAQQNLREVLEATLPPGTAVVWQNSGAKARQTVQRGVVERVRDSVVFVRNEKTQRLVVLLAHRLSSRYGGGKLEGVAAGGFGSTGTDK